jgi:PAS domain-containing protein
MELGPSDVKLQYLITHGIFPTCAYKTLGFEKRSLQELLETVTEPVIAVDADGVVVEANGRAQKVLKKDLGEVQGKRGGDVIECEYARSPGGCGSTEHCLTGCVIRRSVAHTHDTGEGLQRQSAMQLIFTRSGAQETRFTISTEKTGNLVLLRFDEVE